MMIISVAKSFLRGPVISFRETVSHSPKLVFGTHHIAQSDLVATFLLPQPLKG